MQRRQVLGGLAAWGCTTPRAQVSPASDRAAARPSPDYVDVVWQDPARRRAVPLRVRWPAGGAPCAAVVFSHGLGGSREGGEFWGRQWQQAGFAVFHVQHPGSDVEVLRRGIDALRGAANGEQLVARVEDMRFVLDELGRRARESGPWSRVRLDRIGAAGHSFGAQTTLALAGKRYAGRSEGLAEPRFRAFVALSPSLGRYESGSASEQLGGIERPLLAVTGSHDGDPLGSDLTGADRARVYDGLPSGQRALLWLEGADHMTMGGSAGGHWRTRVGRVRRSKDAVALEPAHHALVARYTTLWWRAKLLGDDDALRALSAPEGLAPADRWRMD